MRQLAMILLAGCGDPETEPDGPIIAQGSDHDIDGDGFDSLASGGDDCQDENPAINPGAAEVPYDGVDQDCSGADLTDVDGDGYEVGATTDCDDTDSAVHIGAPEIWFDGIDQDCGYDCDYDPDGDGAIGQEWQAAITGGSPCDRAVGSSVGAPLDCDESDPEVNTQQVVAVEPADGAVGVDSTALMVVALRDIESGVTVRLLDPAGAEVPIEVLTEPQEITFWRLGPVPGHSGYPLDALTTYTLEVEHSCGIESTTFTTGAGLEVVDPAGLVGTTWALAPTGLSSVGAVALDYFENWATIALVEVTGSDGANLDLRFAPAEPSGSQDLCTPTSEVHGFDFAANPVLGADPVDLPLVFIRGFGTPVPVVHHQGGFDATLFDGTLIFVAVHGLVDTEEIAAAAEVEADVLCGVAGGCVPCPHTGASTCFEEAIQFEGAMEPSGPALVPRSAEEIAVDPACAG